MLYNGGPVQAQATTNGVFHTDLRVRYEETDQGGVVYHANYLRYLEVARVELLRERGFDYASWERDGLRLLVIEANLRYRAPGFFDDVLRIEIEQVRTGAARIEVDYRVHRVDSSHRGAETGQTVITAKTVHACVDEAGRPRRLPAEIADALRGSR